MNDSAAEAQSGAARPDFISRLHRIGPGFPVTRGLLAINLLVFLGMSLGGAPLLSGDGVVAAHWGSNYGPLTLAGQWWRLLSAMFIHFGLVHVAVNMYSLYQTGALVERLFGSGQFLLLYLFAGVCGNLVSLLWNPLLNSAGASGAIFGIVGGLMVYLFDARHGVPVAVMRSVRRSALGIVAVNLLFGAVQPGIDNAGHIGGLVSGGLAGWLLARPLDEAFRRRHPAGGLSSTLIALVLIVAVALPLISVRAARLGLAPALLRVR